MDPAIFERLTLAALCTQEGIWDWRLDSHAFFASARWHEMLGRAGQAPITHRDEWLALVHPLDRTRLLGDLDQFFRSTDDHFAHEHRLQHADGDFRWMAIRAVAVRDDEGRARRLVGVQNDVSERRQFHELALSDSLLDPLTQLAGRRWFARRLNRALERASRYPDYHFALLFIDLDDFKLVNDTYGHLIGDAVLAETAQRLQSCVRPGDMAARRGGDEFTVLIDDLNDPDDACKIAERIRAKLSLPIEMGERQICISASVGVAVSSQGFVSCEHMLDAADRSMYKAKRRGAAISPELSQAPADERAAAPLAPLAEPA
jgi:diguanylate cyclase (GGDEF)-like protein/PAS domain S-box-containing protein